MDRLHWIQGNKLKLAIPLTIVYLDDGKMDSRPYTSTYIDTVKVILSSSLCVYEYTPLIDGNILYIEDNGQLVVGTYSIEIIITEKDNTKRRSKWNKVLQVHDDNSKTLAELDDFPSYAEGAIIEGNIFISSGNTPGGSNAPLPPTDLSEYAKQEDLEALEQEVETLSDEVDSIDEELDSKQEHIEDIEAIREGAAKGETALQEDALKEYYTKEEISTLISQNDIIWNDVN